MSRSSWVVLALLVALTALTLVPSAASAPQAGSATSSAVSTALDHVRASTADYGLQKADVAELLVTDAYTDADTGISHVYLRQSLDGLQVLGANMTVTVKYGRVVYAPSSFVANLASAASGRADLGAVEALEAAADELGLELTRDVRVLAGSAGPVGEAVLSNGGVASGPIAAELAYQRLDDGSVRLVWHLDIEEASGEHHWNASVDAATGELVASYDNVVHDDPAATAAATASEATSQALADPFPESRAPETVDEGSSYLVYPIPLESPLDGDRRLVESPADALASPFGWHDTDGVLGPEFTRTQGNNAHAYTDRIAPANVPDPGSDPDGGPGLDFVFPLDLTLDPFDYADAAVTNLFYWCNVVHDVLYRHGFTEVAGNYQVNNYGRGGVGGDHVRCEAQDGAGTNNANFASGGADGGLPRMQMFLWTATLQNRVTVDAPSSAAGSYRASGAAFGPATTLAGISGQIVQVNDGSANPTQGCGPLVGFPAGAIALADRGGCPFVQIVGNAQAAGASAVIVGNNVAGNPITMGGADPTITIPSVMVSLPSANTIKAGLPATGTVARDPETSLRRDGDLDAGIIAHEYGHGVSNRLSGGPSTTACLGGQEQMGEGWSDWQAVTLTALPTDTPEGMRGVGGYALYQPSRYDIGIRPTAYSTDMTVNPSSYNLIRTAAVPHGVGYVWNTMLWEVYWNLVEKHGFNPNVYESYTTGGNNLAIRLVHDGMKMQVCSPGFVQGRDAILAADDALTGGDNECEIWRGFTKRGLGASAVQGTSASRLDNTESFDPPASCFFSKPESPSALTKANAGSAQPLHFSLVGDKGLDVFEPGSPSSQRIDCTTLAPIGASTPTASPGGSGLSYDAATDTYNYVWKTEKSWDGTCRRVTLVFGDVLGTLGPYEYTADFDFRK